MIPVLNEKASSVTFYRKGAWALHILRENIGHQKFQKAVKNYLKKYKFKNVTTDQFLAEIKKVTPYDVGSFRKRWLEKPGFEYDEALSALMKNSFIKQYLAVQKMQDIPFAEKKSAFETILKSDAFYPLKQEAIYQTAAVPVEDKKELIRIGFESNDVKVRQAVAQTMTEIPAAFKTQYESLLDDASYTTREIALQTLWGKFPEDRMALVTKSENWIGLNDKNLRIIWLTLALATPEYRPEKKKELYQEMADYASINFDSSIRQNALEMLLRINPTYERVLQSLAGATVHHKWQFVKFGKDSIRILLKKEEYKKLFEALLPKLTDRERVSLSALLSEK
jgi:aminopeptidase N